MNITKESDFVFCGIMSSCFKEYQIQGYGLVSGCTSKGYSTQGHMTIFGFYPTSEDWIIRFSSIPFTEFYGERSEVFVSSKGFISVGYKWGTPLIEYQSLSEEKSWWRIRYESYD